MNFKELISALPFEFERSICYKLNSWLKRRPSSAPYLSGDTFARFADFSIENQKQLEDFCKNIENVNKTENFRQKLIILVSSNLLVDFANSVLPKISVPFVLLSHQGDANITPESTNADVFLQIAQNQHLVCWFAQNCTLQHEKIVPLPIGLENQRFHNAGNVASFKKLQKKLRAGKIRKQPKVLVALNLATNPDKRFCCYRAFWHKPAAKELSSFVSSQSYRKIAASCMFVASPAGNGLDCHRTWEAMYLDCVALAEQNPMNEYFKNLGLPVICVSDWATFAQKTEAELVQIYNETMKNCDRSALQAEYWQNKMKGAFNA